MHAVIAVVLAGILFASVRAAGKDDGLLHVYFLDVGQGDAILIESPNRTQVLIDGGPDESVLEELSRVMPPLDRSIDAVVVSHPHADHIGGLARVLAYYDVGTVLEANITYDSGQFRALGKAVEEEKAARVDAVAGTFLDFGGGVTLTVMHPFVSANGAVTENPHDSNVATVLSYDNTEILFAGDMEASSEQALISRNMPIDADVLKVGHHGSAKSSSAAFLRAVTPQAAVISVGENNRYHHPAPSTLARLERMGIRYFRTDSAGAIELVSDGNEFFFRTGD